MRYVTSMTNVDGGCSKLALQESARRVLILLFARLCERLFDGVAVLVGFDKDRAVVVVNDDATIHATQDDSIEFASFIARHLGKTRAVVVALHVVDGVEYSAFGVDRTSDFGLSTLERVCGDDFSNHCVSLTREVGVYRIGVF